MSGFSTVLDRYRVSTDPLRTQRRIELAAVLLGLVLCLQLLIGTVGLLTMATPAAVPPAADSVEMPPVHNSEIPDASQRNEFLARPLFWEGRHPGEAFDPRVDADAKRGQSGQLSDVKLVGVFGSGQSAGVIALVRGAKRRILIGEKLDDWTLKSVDPTGCVFGSGVRRETLALQRAEVVAAPGGVRANAVKITRSGAASAQDRRGEKQKSESSGAAAAAVSGAANVVETEPTLSLGPTAGSQ